MAFCSSDGGHAGRHPLEVFPVKPVAVLDDAARVAVNLVLVSVGAEQVAEVPGARLRDTDGQPRRRG